jgi:hypothetical protein
VLKLVMKIVVALAEGEERHEKRISRAAFRGIGLTAYGVAGRVNKKGAVLKDDGLRYASQEETAERAVPAVPDRADHGRQNHPHRQSEKMDVTVLPHHEPILL